MAGPDSRGKGAIFGEGSQNNMPYMVAGFAASAMFVATLTVATAMLKFQRKAPVAPFIELDEE